MNVPTVVEVMDHLNVTSPTQVPELERNLNAAVAVVEGLVGPLAPRVVVDRIPHPGGSMVVLRTVPVIAVTDLRTSVAAGGTPEVFDTAKVILDGPAGVLTYRGGLPAGWLEATYTAGWPAGELPANLHQAVLEQTRHLWETQRGGMASRAGAEGGGMGARGFTVPNRVLQYVERHRQLDGEVPV